MTDFKVHYNVKEIMLFKMINVIDQYNVRDNFVKDD